MKKTFIILTVFVFCLQMTGLSQKTRVGVSGGITIANMTGTVGGVKLNDDSQTGISLGMFVDAPLSNHFSVQPGVYYVQKGKSKEAIINGSDVNTIIALRYAEFPINFLYNTNGSNGNFFVGAGPYFGLHLPSKKVSEIAGKKSATDIIFGNKGSEDYQGIDYGANLLAGFRLTGGLFLSVNYSKGLCNIVPGTGNDKIKNNYFGIQLGILVNNKNK